MRERKDSRDWATLVRQYLDQGQDQYLADAIEVAKQEAEIGSDLRTKKILQQLVRLLEAFREQDLETILSLSQDLTEAFQQ